VTWPKVIEWSPAVTALGVAVKAARQPDTLGRPWGLLTSVECAKGIAGNSKSSARGALA